MIWIAVCAAMGMRANTLYVDPRGDDRAIGDDHHPLATIQQAIKDLHRHQTGASATIIVNPGIYELTQPIHIGAEDLASPLMIEAGKPNRPPAIAGSRAIQGWKIDEHGRWTVRLPEVASGQWYFSDLFVNGVRRNRPRFPETGYAHISAGSSPGPNGADSFGFAEGEFDPAWTNQDDVELVLFHNWFTTTGRVASVANHTITLKQPTGFKDGWADLSKGNRYLVDNVKELLQRPGQWYLDRPTGVLTYIPLPGESPEHTEVRAPVAPALLEVKGDPARNAIAKGLTLRHLRFEHTAWNIPSLGRSFPQAEADLNGALRFEDAADVKIENCEISQVGEYAIKIGADCRNIAVDHVKMTDLGAGGVKIGVKEIDPNPKRVTADCRVNDCLIVGGGRRAPAAVGVWIGQSHGNTISHNTIEDLYYTGVSVGWTWGYGPSEAHDNLIQDNRIARIGQGVLSDMGGIYTLGVSPGSALRGNFIHDVDSFSYGGWGIYPDEGTSKMLIEDNVVTRCKSAGLHQHYGQDNDIRHNIFAFNRENQLMRTRAEDHISFNFHDNVVIWKSGELLGSNWSGTGFHMDRNLYWQVDGKPFTFAGQSFADWKARGLDLNSQIIDPQFQDPEHDRFSLRLGSPLAVESDGEQPWRRIAQIVPTSGCSYKLPAPLPRAWP